MSVQYISIFLGEEETEYILSRGNNVRKCPITRGPCCPLILERLSKMNRGPRIEIGGAYTFLDKRKIWQLKKWVQRKKGAIRIVTKEGTMDIGVLEQVS